MQRDAITLPLFDTFDLLARESGVRNPLPHRENRGLCPAHEDRHNPALVFTITDDESKLLVHCFAQECRLEHIAYAIGVTPQSFFATKRKGWLPVPPPTWEYPPILDLLKMLPITRHFDDEAEAVFAVMDHLGHPWTQPLRDLPKVTVDEILWEYLNSEFDPDKHNWHTVRDMAHQELRKLNLTYRRNSEMERA